MDGGAAYTALAGYVLGWYAGVLHHDLKDFSVKGVYLFHIDNVAFVTKSVANIRILVEYRKHLSA